MNRSRTALITGASRGIGEEFCRLFAADGYDLVLVSRDAEKMTDLKRELERRHPAMRVRMVAQDLAAPGAVGNIAASLDTENITLDSLVNNAGFGDAGAFAEEDPERIRAMLRLNVEALTELTRLLLPRMLERGTGRILNVASIAAFQPGPNMAVYYATKAYVLSFSAALREELRGSGVTVTCLCPGPTKTGFAQNARMEHSRLFGARPFGLADAASVAAAGYRAMRDGRGVVIPGFRNAVGAYAARLIPLWLSARIAGRVNEGA